MIKSFIMALVGILSIAAICITISVRNVLAGIFVSLIGIVGIIAIVALFVIPVMFGRSIHTEHVNIIDAEM